MSTTLGTFEVYSHVGRGVHLYSPLMWPPSFGQIMHRSTAEEGSVETYVAMGNYLLLAQSHKAKNT